MLTPSFKLQQDNEFLLLQINAPYVKANDVELYMEGNEFKFYVKPYFLRLRFQKEVVEDGRETASYDISAGIFNIKIPKKSKGETFEDLDMLTTLLATKETKNNIKPNIEELESNQEEKNRDDEEEVEEEFNWECEQTVYNEPSVSSLLNHKYGFGNQTSGVFSRLKEEFYDVIDVQDPDNTPIKERRRMRNDAEIEKFDRDHYLADFYDDSQVKELMKFTTKLNKEHNRILSKYKSNVPPETKDLVEGKGYNAMFSQDTNIEFTEEENYTMLKLPNKNYLLSKEEEQWVWLGLVDIMFAYCYDCRTTEEESTSESGWTICKLSSTLSWLDSFTSLHETLRSNYVRCMCYPLYRNWELTDRVFEDLKMLFSLGKRWIVRCLLEIRKILLAHDSRYILNDLYITDYIVWLQKQKERKLCSLSNKLNCEKIEVSEMPFDLRTFEEEKEEEEEKLCEKNQDSSSESEEDDSGETDSDDIASGEEGD